MFRLFVRASLGSILFGLLMIAPGLSKQPDITVTSPAGPTQIVLTPVLSGLTDLAYITNAKDGTNRLFVVELPGIIKVVQPGSTSPTVFLDISSRVIAGGELGLFCIAFHPQYQTNRRFFVHYTRASDAANVVAEYRTSATNPNVAEMTEIVYLVITGTESNHNGGMIEFGPDGYLYIGFGDGGSQNDPFNRAQNVLELSGKILRIDVNNQNGEVPYSSPPDNPYAGPLRGRDEIYALGMRNPWRFSFDRGTGQLWIGDVGGGLFEEIDIGQLGGNYGWRIYEGNHCTNVDPPLCIPAGFVFPIAEYGHTGGRCSITGGYVYRGFRSSIPTGAYIYGDLCTGEIFMLQGGTQTLLLDSPHVITSFGEDEAGEIYMTALGGSVSAVFRIDNPNAPAPRNKISDFDGDDRTDLSVFRPVTGVWHIRQSLNGALRAHQLGTSSDRIAPGDYDGDGKTDVAIFQSTGGIWSVLRSGNNNLIVQSFGLSGDLPVARDYDNDGKADLAVFRPVNGVWFILQSTSNTLRAEQFGIASDRPVPADYDGDGKADIAVYRNGIWYVKRSSDSVIFVQQFGISNDRTVAADYVGDGKADVAVYRQSNGTWYLSQSSQGFRAQQFGISSDEPAPGDYDGDDKSDVAVYRNGVWYILQSQSGLVRTEQFGVAGDIPIPAGYIQ